MQEGQPARDPMLGRIVRFADLRRRGDPVAFIDSVLPGHQRLNYALIGDTAIEDAEADVIIKEHHKFQIGMVMAPPGNGPAYHTHDYIEAFIPLTGRWRFYWGDDPDAPAGEAMLEPWDLISLPPRLWRGFENADDRDAWILGILEEHDPGGKDPYWSPQVIRQAGKFGLQADERGKMIKPAHFQELRKRVEAQFSER